MFGLWLEKSPAELEGLAAEVAAVPPPLPSCDSIDCRSAEKDCRNVATFPVAAAEPVLLMLSPVEFAVVELVFGFVEA